MKAVILDTETTGGDAAEARAKLAAEIEAAKPERERMITYVRQCLDGVPAPSYRRQFDEMVQVWGPVDEYARRHPKVKLGSSLSAFVLERLKELDRIEEQQK